MQFVTATRLVETSSTKGKLRVAVPAATRTEHYRCVTGSDSCDATRQRVYGTAEWPVQAIREERSVRVGFSPALGSTVPI